MLTDIEIAQRAKLKPIEEIAGMLGINATALSCTATTRPKSNRRFMTRLKTGLTEISSS